MFGLGVWLRQPMKRSQVQSLLLLGLFAFFVAHFVLLSPSGLEEDFNGVRVIHPRDLLNFLKNEPYALARGIPTDIAPSYSIRTMNFYASNENEPSWHLNSRKSNLYQAQQLVHSRDAELTLPDGTKMLALEMAMWQAQDRTELYGDVRMLLPNGLSIKTEYAEIRNRPKLLITVPLTQKVIGHRVDGTSTLDFESMGLTHSEAENGDTRLLSQVQVWIKSDKQTQVKSDYALYQPTRGLLSFQMFEQQSIEKQFVRANQNDLLIRSRSLEIQLARRASTANSSSAPSEVEVITALGDVKIDDRHDPTHPATGTSGKALYYTGKNEIILTDYPQVYQDGDTITGDIIVFNRNQDSIEVKQSNAIYQRR
jgi:lipopolysaccharide transport protein LptA